MSLPRWNDPRLNLGSMVRVALWLATEVGQGNTFTQKDLRDAFPGVAQIARRMRDLRDYGWVLETSREDPTLSTEELRLTTIGTPVWNAQERRTAQLVRAAPPFSATQERVHRRSVQPSDPDAVRKQVAALPHDDKVLVLAWLVKGRRDHTPAEQAFNAAQALPPEARQALMTQLADDLVGQIKETRPMTD
ncbi:hypothetical protein [Lentzea flava]|uniref:Uncharacterized protein n=1 Tax=Lentzea flava TaxID=103732 RepID=A0ABQ2V4C2_9PSEU|nr:hypothetical protein [Lentzea flava]MCP2203447.1 hypothetical protein [Lentzea flava]GGU67871.1 hypothetical protein GCM10010178_69530 [Lentzea flava]